MKKRLAFFLMALGLCCALTTVSAPARAAAYPDIEGHWAKPAIERWSDSGILKGYADGRFAPNDPISRAQLSEILYRVWGCKPNSARTFTDVPTNAWYYDGLTTMATYGVTLTDGDKARPDELLTREEAFYMVARAFYVGSDVNSEYLSSKIADGADISPAYRARLMSMVDSGFLKGDAAKRFNPKNTVTRAEVIQVMDNMFDRYIDKPGEYTVSAGEIALITSPGVTVTVEKERYVPVAKVYAMNKALSDGSLTFLDGGVRTMELYGVSEGQPAWKTEDGSWVRSHVVTLSDPKQVPCTGFAGGLGTQASPYRIATGEQFLLMEELPTQHPTTEDRLDYYFELTNDIELPACRTSVKTPMYFHLDGKGHTVTYHMKGETSRDQYNHGLFESLTSAREVHDLTVAGSMDLTVRDPDKALFARIGGLAGLVQGGELKNCRSEMEITVRYPSGRLQDLKVGGLVGGAEECILANCTTGADLLVSAKRDAVACDVGGLVGTVSQAQYGLLSETAPGVSGAPSSEERQTILRRCGSDAKVTVTGGYHSCAGGLVGRQTFLGSDTKLTAEGYGVIEGCWSTAEVSVTRPGFQGDCGGLVGQVHAGTIQQSWSKPTLRVVTDSRYIYQNLGGIAGSGAGTRESHITDCWTDVSGLMIPEDGGHYGGIAGRLGAEVARCFVLGNEDFAPENAISYASWTDVDPTNCFAMAGKTAGDLAAFYETCGWNFAAVWDNSGTYPILCALPAEAQRAAQAK